MDYRFKTKPFAHQKACFEQNLDKVFFAYLMEMGTGKSKVLLDTAAYMYDQGWVNALLILANKGSYLNWATNELPTHMPDHVQTELVVWRAGMGKAEERTLEHLIGTPGLPLKILLMNAEALAYERSYHVALRFCTGYRTMVAYDESTQFANIKALRTKAAMKISSACKVRRIMTGSLVDNRPLQAFSQFELLEKSCLGFSSYYSFRAQYAEMFDMTTRNSPRPFKVVKGFKNLEDLKRRISKHSFIIKKEECLDLPPKTYQTYYVDMTAEQEKLYDDLKRRSMTEIGGELASVKIVLTKLLRLHQLVCGHLKDDLGVVHDVSSNRIAALMSVLEETSGQVVIWANYLEDIHKIEKALVAEYGRELVVTYYGATEDQDRKTVSAAFLSGSGSPIRFCIANQQTGGYGNNWTGANFMIYYSNNYDAEKRNQSEARMDRYGQTKPMTYVDLVAKGTVDEKILKALKDKKSLSELLTASNWKEFV